MATTTSSSNQSSFCGAETQESSSPCNATFPAVCMTHSGKVGIVWQDTRDGNYEIYFKALDSEIGISKNTSLDPTTGREVNFECSGFSSIMPIAQICATTSPSGASAGIARYSGGRLDVNKTALTAVLTADATVDFTSLGVAQGTQITVENGLNAGKALAVTSVLSPTILEVAYYDGLVSDTGFVYTVVSNAGASASPCDVRLTCDLSTSVYPDIQADGAGRFHIVYQDNPSGHYELYYVQLYPSDVGSQTCTGTPPFIGVSLSSSSTSIPPVPTVVSTSNPSIGNLYASGDPSVPDPIPNDVTTGGHRLYMDPVTGKWTGVSYVRNRATWNAATANAYVPPFIAPTTSLTNAGDFGEQYSFPSIAFMIQSHPTLQVAVDKIRLPIKPRCASVTSTQASSQSFTPLPTRPVPLGFSDPVDLSQLLNSPSTSLDSSSPSRFTIDGDTTGTVFTNIVSTSGQQTSRFVFTQSHACGANVEFILGQVKCGSELCGIGPTQSDPTLGGTTPSPTLAQSRLQVWMGMIVQRDPTHGSLQTMPAVKVFDGLFEFENGADLSTYSFNEGDLFLSEGRYYFVVVTPIKDTNYYIDAVGGGHSIWSTDGSGTFTQYYKPWTLEPFAGLFANAYYEGTLKQKSDTTAPTISLPSNVSVLSPNSVPLVVTYPPVTVKDDSDPSPSVVYSSPSGSTFPLGDTLVTITATDASGNQSTATFTVQVLSPQCSAANGSTDYSASVNSLNPTDTVGESLVTYQFGANPQTVAQPFYFTGGTVDVYLKSITVPNLKMPPGGSVGMLIRPVYTVGVVPGQLWSQLGVVALSDLTVSTTGTFEFNCTILGPGAQYAFYLFALPFPQPANSFSVDMLSAFGDPDGLFPAAVQVGAVPYLGTNGTGFYMGAYNPIAPGKPGFSYFIPFEIKFSSFQVGTTLPGVGFKTATKQDTFVPPPTTTVVTVPTTPSAVVTEGTGDLVQVSSSALTSSSGNSVHPRTAIDSRDNIWLVFYSDRTGTNEVYVAKYSAGCWGTSAQGGGEARLTNSGANSKQSLAPSVAVDSFGDAHVAYQSDDTEDAKPEIFYTRTRGGGASFVPPIRITSSPGSAILPDITVDNSTGDVTIVWHDDRFGDYEIMSATKSNGSWLSSAQGGADTRVTASAGDSLFPRIVADKKGNLRVVYHDYRNGSDHAGVFMSTYVSSTGKWDSSGQGGVDRLISLQGQANSLHPDVAVDRTSGLFLVWHDDRTKTTTSQTQVYGAYCSRLDAQTSCLSVLTQGEYTRLDVTLVVVDCTTGEPAGTTTSSEVCLKISSPGATFFRLANEDGNFSDWASFSGGSDADSVIVPWTLSCGNGSKSICVQVQDPQFLGIPVCASVILQAPQPIFDIQMFSDSDLTIPLPSFAGMPVATDGDIYLKISSCTKLSNPPVFDVISHGLHIVTNQGTTEMSPSGFSGSSGASGFSGFSSVAGTTYKARFHVHRDDGLFHKDGRARIVVHGVDSQGNQF